MNRLLVIYRNGLSSIIQKGELVPRYFNPGGTFSEVHIISINQERPDPEQLKVTVGNARLVLHNLPPPSLTRTLLWPRSLLVDWVRKGVALAQSIAPDLIRVYGNGIEGYLASRIKGKLGLPLVLSLHTNPDITYRELGPKRIDRWLKNRVSLYFEITSLRAADKVIAVYKAIVPYLDRRGISHYCVIYNAVGQGLEPKQDYSLHTPARIICVGRQTPLLKNPENIIRAMVDLPGVELTLVGDGEIHGDLVDLACRLELSDKIKFIKAVPNAELLKLMQKQDIYVFHSYAWEFSKTIMEAALIGLPIVTNRRLPQPAPEFGEAEFSIQVDDSAKGYVDALRRLLEVESLREDLGRNGREYAVGTFSPDAMEQRVVDLYKDLMDNASTEVASERVAKAKRS